MAKDFGAEYTHKMLSLIYYDSDKMSKGQCLPYHLKKIFNSFFRQALIPFVLYKAFVCYNSNTAPLCCHFVECYKRCCCCRIKAMFPMCVLHAPLLVCVAKLVWGTGKSNLNGKPQWNESVLHKSFEWWLDGVLLEFAWMHMC